MAGARMAQQKQAGISLVGLIFVLGILGLIAVLGMKIVPTVTEFMAVKKAMNGAKTAGGTIVEIRNAFDRQADVGYIESVSGKDLLIVPKPEGADISIEYQKKIPLFGPASLVIDYEATTIPEKR